MRGKFSKVERICKHCGTSFLGRPDYVQHKRGSFCSKACYVANAPARAESLFWQKIHKTEGCWLWQGQKDRKGYGMVTYLQRFRSTHRIAWELTRGPIPEGLCVLHHCDTPACCNPEHLFLGTLQDNLADMRSKGRDFTKLNEEQVREIRTLKLQGITFRELGERFGVTQECIQMVVYRKTWKEV